MLLNDDNAEIEKPHGLCSPNFLADGFLGFFFYSHQSFLLNIQDLYK